MALGVEEMRRRNQEVFIKDLEAHFGFPLHDYSYYYPPTSAFMPRGPPPEGEDVEAKITMYFTFRCT